MIYHITTIGNWNKFKKKDYFSAESLKTDGFIHCSYKNQIIKVAEYLFSGQQDLIILRIDELKLAVDLISEDLYELNEKYPHIYGKVNLNSILNTEPLKFKNGSFCLPENI